MTGALLRQVLEQGDRNRGIGGFLLRAGAEASLDTLRRYRVVTSDFLISGGEQNLGYLSERNPALKLIRTLRDVRLVLIDELKRRFGR